MSSSSSPYAPAAKVLNQMWGTHHRRGLKSVVYSSKGELTCSKATFAQCSHVIQHKAVLDELVHAATSKGVQAKNEGLMYVLVYELMMGPNKAIRGGGALKRQLTALHDVLQQRLEEVVSKEQKGRANNASSTSNYGSSGPSSNKPLRRTTIPRYVRINTLRADRESVIDHITAKTTKDVYIDPHVPDLLVMEPTAESREILQDLVASHQVVLQDKSSCFSALCLMDGYDSDRDDDEEEVVDDDNDVDDNRRKKDSGSPRSFDYLDACAAPGNKTSHLAALIHDRNSAVGVQQQADKPTRPTPTTIHALDMSPDRFKLLRRRMEELAANDDDEGKNGATNTVVNVRCHKLDFLQQWQQVPAAGSSSNTSHQRAGGSNRSSKAEPDSSHGGFEHVRAILLDPSCSGSGMTGNNNHNHHTEASASLDPYHCDDRIRSLSDFQFHALKHALTAFPNVDRVVYSTCSVYVKENESVVARVLDAVNSHGSRCRDDDEDDDTRERRLRSQWELVAPKCLRGWHRRGVVEVPMQADGGDTSTSTSKTSTAAPTPQLTPEQAKCVIRADPHQDATNGFFVACLQRCRPAVAPQQKPQQQQKTTKAKKKKTTTTKRSSSSSDGRGRQWKSPAESDRPKGLELYDNQFDTSNEETKESSDKTISAPKAAAPTTPKVSSSSSKEATKRKYGPSSSKGQKRKAKEEPETFGCSSSNDNATTKETGCSSSDNNNKASKKRSKKADWKLQQRLKKEARLKLNKSAST